MDIKTIAFCIFICFIPMMGIAINNCEILILHKILLIYLQTTVLAPLHQLTVFQETPFQGLRKLWFLIPERAVSSKKNSLST
jgi:hypothetical protein